MEPGDITVLTTHHGQRKVAIVLEKFPDGRYSVFCPPPTYLAVEASAEQGVRGTLFDPTLPPVAAEGEPAELPGMTPEAPIENRGDVEDEPATPDAVDEPAEPDQGE